MTLASTARRAGPFLGNGVTDAFPFSFRVFSKAELSVVLTDAAGNESVLALDAQYTVSLNPDQLFNPGGSVTPVTPVLTGQTLAIIGSLPLDQPLDLPSGGRFPPEALENALDRIVMQIQQQTDLVKGSLRVSELSVLPSIPPVAIRKNTILAFDTAGNPTVLVPASGSAADVLIQLANGANLAQGDALIKVKQPFTGSVERTGHEKNSDLVSIKDAGGVADNGITNNTAALGVALARGGLTMVPDGIYAFSTPVSVSYDGAFPLIGALTKRYELIGNSKNNVIFTYSGSNYWLNSLGSANLGTEGIHAYDTLKNLSLLGTLSKGNNAIKYDGKSYFKIESVHVNGFSEGIRLDSCFTGSLEDIYLRDNNFGLILSGATFPRAPNAIQVSRFTCQLNANWGVLAEACGEANIFEGGTVEACGTHLNASTGGMKLDVTLAANGFGCTTLRGVYFELNRGGADLEITNSGTKKAVVLVDACFFNRALVNSFTTSNIKLRNTGTGSLTVIVKGCGFFSTDTYVPSAARPFFDVGAGCELINGGGNSFSETVSLPNTIGNRPAGGEMLSAAFNGAGANVIALQGVTCVRNSAGVYTVTNAKGWGVDAQGYVAQAMSNDTGAGVIVQRITQSNANSFVVVTAGQTSGVLTDCPFSITVNRLC